MPKTDTPTNKKRGVKQHKQSSKPTDTPQRKKTVFKIAPRRIPRRSVRLKRVRERISSASGSERESTPLLSEHSDTDIKSDSDHSNESDSEYNPPNKIMNESPHKIMTQTEEQKSPQVTAIKPKGPKKFFCPLCDKSYHLKSSLHAHHTYVLSVFNRFI